jgi:non-specific serine/threonine protein kinase
VSGHRFVTVTGVGGVGKTRLVQQARDMLAPRFPDGVWLVELAELRTAVSLLQAVGDTIGLREHSAQPREEVLAAFLAGKDLLLVMDSCERLAAPCADLAGTLLAAAPRLRILATSRQPLARPREHLLPLAPLSVRPACAAAGGAEGIPGDAVRLFLDRAAKTAPELSQQGFDLSAVADLCQRLDGIPLAIELAAARLRTLSLEQIRTMLDDRFGLLANHGRRGAPRHHALRTTIGWSHELCTPAERLLWARLSVFPAPFDLQAAQAVCVDRHLSTADIAPTLTSLAAKSLLTRDGRGAQCRYRMLDTVRDYGSTWLKSLDAHDDLERRHAAYYLSLVRRAEAAWSGPGQLAWHARMGRNHPHLRAALDFQLDHPSHTKEALELAARLWFVWIGAGRLHEGRQYLERALNAHPAPCTERTRALCVYGWIASVQIDPSAATPYLAEAAADAARLGDPENAAFALQWQGQVAFLHGNWEQAIALLTRAIAQYGPKTPLNPGPLPARTALAAAWLARAHTREALTVLTEAHDMCVAAGEIWMRSHLDWLHAQADRSRGHFSTAIARSRDALWVQHAFHDVIGMAVTLEVLAGLRAALLDGEQAARLLGGALRLRRTYAVAVTGAPFLAAIRAQATRSATEQLGATRYERIFLEGTQRDTADLLTYALDAPLITPPAAPITHRRPLSTTEAAIAQLTARGLSNETIAERRNLSTAAVGERIQDILATLGLADRTDLITWASWRWPHHNPPEKG